MTLVCQWCAKTGAIIGPLLFGGGFSESSIVSMLIPHLKKKEAVNKSWS